LDLRTKTETLLASVVVDLEVPAVSNLFVVPAGKNCIITRVVMREPDGAVATAELTFGFDALALDVIGTPQIYALTATENYIVIPANDDAVRGVGAEIFKIDVETDEGEARTATIDVFGYLYDTP